MEAKSAFRRELIAKRMSLTSDEIAKKSDVIFKKLRDLGDWQMIKRVHIYDSNAAWNEVRTDELVDFIRSQWPAIKIYSSTVSPFSALPSRQFDLVIVPVLGFDSNNYRIGMGAGWYDRFLAAQPSALKIGLSYQFSRVHKLPVEWHDIPLDRIVTESNVY